MMNNETIKNVRSINYHFGRLTAVKWVRAALNLPYEVAKMVVDDAITYKPWTKPNIKPDLNYWELNGVTPVRIGDKSDKA